MHRHFKDNNQHSYHAMKTIILWNVMPYSLVDIDISRESTASILSTQKIKAVLALRFQV
jgi:hypothetical protein